MAMLLYSIKRKKTLKNIRSVYKSDKYKLNAELKKHAMTAKQ